MTTRVEIPEEDLRLEIFKNDAVNSLRLTHIPTGTYAEHSGPRHQKDGLLFNLRNIAYKVLCDSEKVIDHYKKAFGYMRDTSVTVETVLAEHQMEFRGMTYGTADRCLCGEKTYPERGEEDVTIRRHRAFAAHQNEVLQSANLVASLTEWGVKFPSGNVENFGIDKDKALRHSFTMNKINPSLPTAVYRKVASDWEIVTDV